MKRLFLGFPLSLIILFQASIIKAQSVVPRAELITRITNAYPALSPDASKMAYMSNADGDFDIYILHLNERVLGKLTDTQDRDGTPVWSPDGSQIAFQTFRDGHSQIYTMAADGHNQLNISRSESNDEHPFWSADGNRILFCSDRTRTKDKEDNNIDIFEMAADGSNVRQITRTPEVETYASWSFDGTRIVCRKILKNADWEIVVMNSDGSNPKNLSNQEGIDGWPVWSPDGKSIAYASVYGDHTRIFIMNADGTNKRRISDDVPFDDRQPWWHPDGSSLLFSRYQWFEGHPWYEASEIYITSTKD
jgi:TolB protein